MSSQIDQSGKATITRDSDDTFREMRHVIRNLYGDNIELVFDEAVANALEHGSGCCCVEIGKEWISVRDCGGGITSPQSEKEVGLGGYGLGIITNSDSFVLSSKKGTVVLIRKTGNKNNKGN